MEPPPASTDAPVEKWSDASMDGATPAPVAKRLPKALFFKHQAILDLASQAKAIKELHMENETLKRQVFQQEITIARMKELMAIDKQVIHWPQQQESQ